MRAVQHLRDRGAVREARGGVELPVVVHELVFLKEILVIKPRGNLSEVEDVDLVLKVGDVESLTPGIAAAQYIYEPGKGHSTR